MPNISEMLNDPAFQTYLSQNAERWFPLEQLESPTVIFDRGTDNFWPTIMNSPKKDDIIKKIRAGDVIPSYADALHDAATNHAIFQLITFEAGIPIIPSVIRILGMTKFLENHNLPTTAPGIWVRKSIYEDKQMVAHRGEGVSMIKILPSTIPTPETDWVHYQRFVLPPQEHVRDIRTLIVGGEAVTGFIRRAQEPLNEANRQGLLLPSDTQYPTAHHPGPPEPLQGDLRYKVFNVANKIAEALGNRLRRWPNRPYSPHSPLGFASIDFVQDANGVPLPVDFDINPEVRNYDVIHKQLGEALAWNLMNLSVIDGKVRDILVIGHKEDGIVSQTLANLEKLLPKGRFRFQPDFISAAYQAYLEQRRNTTQAFDTLLWFHQNKADIKRQVGRNESCPCGSGYKFKKCHGR